MISPSFCLFVLLYIFSFYLCFNMDDWFLVWMGLELNMISFVLLIYSREDMKTVESCLKYFFVQSLGSSIFMMVFYLNGSGFEFLSSLVLSYKMGGGPFFFWFPSMCDGISWYSCFMLMSFQKLIPLMLMVELIGVGLWAVVFLSILSGAIGSFNQVRMKVLMAFSSINQMGWLLMCMILNKTIWVSYYLTYIVVLFVVLYKMKDGEVNNYLGVMSLESKWWVLLMLMNLGGIPPFLGFFLSWVGFYNMLLGGLFMFMFMIVMSVVMLYVYMRICYGILMGMKGEMGYVKMSVEGDNWFIIKFIVDLFMMMGLLTGGLFMVFFV
uniref:NADH-ubiquinone oxidoreductase chain 2 n=1 Tax=Argyroneta aquatica TaxID=375087 RepID=A0A0E3DRE4_ARGAQ|nr:NADH dehydrogenase subunit 2 [Argyroneta aquatica]AIL95167.1 NADH dehydrogenase subunit 2 [Argyroneta aquatica]